MDKIEVVNLVLSSGSILLILGLTYRAGGLVQKVEDICGRVARIEGKLNGYEPGRKWH